MSEAGFLAERRRRLSRWLGVPAAIALAGFAFAQVAAGLAAPQRPFAAWGPAALQLAAVPGDEAVTRTRMELVERLTRRDVAAQLWLLQDAARRNDVGGTLRGYDVLLRTRSELRDPLTKQLASALVADPVRVALARYADPRTPWFPDFLRAASVQGQAEPAAAILAGLPALPDTPSYRTAYGALVAALASENRFDRLRTLYPRLPGAVAEGYAPLRWALAAGSERDARLGSQDALAVRIAPFAKGEAASRLLLLPAEPMVLSWTAEMSGAGNAHWTVRCRGDAESRRSPDLKTGSGFQALPHPCAAADLALVADGGTGEEATTLRLTRLRWDPAPAQPGNAAR